MTVDLGGPAGGGDPLLALLRVQDLDTALAQLRHRRATLDEQRELDAVEGAMGVLEGRASELGDQRDALVARQAELEEQVAALAARRQGIEDRMYSARGSASRDLQAMDDEVRHLAQHRADIEEVELQLMEEQEPLDAELSRLVDERTQLEAAASSLRAALAAATSVLDVEISTLEASRTLDASRLPADLAERYEGLRARLGGTGAARLIGSRCDGCHLELPSAEVDRIRHLPPGSIVTCDQCGRILVRDPGPGTLPATPAPGPG